MQFVRRERCNKFYLDLLNLQYPESGLTRGSSTCCSTAVAAGDSQHALSVTVAYCNRAPKNRRLKADDKRSASLSRQLHIKTKLHFQTDVRIDKTLPS